MAKDLSAATKTVTDAVTIYANENESVSSMLNKAQPTVLLSAASGMSSSSSADAIQGILNQFNLSKIRQCTLRIRLKNLVLRLH